MNEYEFLEHVLTRPGMYSGAKSTSTVLAFLGGYVCTPDGAVLPSAVAVSDLLVDMRVHLARELGLDPASALALSDYVKRKSGGDDVAGLAVLRDVLAAVRRQRDEEAAAARSRRPDPAPPRDEAGAAVSIAPATEADVPTILSFIRALADYEKLSHLCTATEVGLRETLFGERPYAEALIARVGGVPVGHAIFFHNYSTFLARPGIYIEDIFVLPAHRGVGAGKALLRAVVRIARDRRCARVEWSVLDWNEPAIEFYKRMGADVMLDWRICRVSGDTIDKLADRA
jgi:GNAT superfamily N-acetyltransferase